MNKIINKHFNCNISLQSHDLVLGYLRVHTNKNMRKVVNFACSKVCALEN